MPSPYCLTASPPHRLLVHFFALRAAVALSISKPPPWSTRRDIAPGDPRGLGDGGRADGGGAAFIGEDGHSVDRKQELFRRPDYDSGLSPHRRIGASGSDAGRAETAFLPPALAGKIRDNPQFRPDDAGEDKLGDAVAGIDANPVGAAIAPRSLPVPPRSQPRPLLIATAQPPP